MKTATYIILYLFSNLFRTYDFYYFYKTFHGKTKNQYAPLGFLVFFSLISTEYIILDLPIVTLLLNCIGLLLLNLFFDTSPGHAVICSVIALMSSIFVESTIMLFTGYSNFSFLQTGYYASSFGIVLLPIILFLFCIIYKHTKLISSSTNIPFRFTIVMIIIPIMCIYIVFLLFTIPDIANWQFISITAILMLISVSIVWLYEKQMLYYSQKEQLHILELQNQYFIKQIETATLLEENTQKIRHDMKNHFLSINILADRNNDTDVINYITNIIEDLSPSERIIHTGNYMIDGLFNYFISIANNNNIHTKCDVSFPSDLIINEHDITILLGNLWDNCIENAMTCINGSIHFNLNYNKNRILLSCDNSFSGSRERIGSSFLSTKANKALHGIGLKNVKQIVDKYKGTINYDINNNIFSVKIIMYFE